MTAMKLGLDVGRVLIQPASMARGTDTSFVGGSAEAVLSTPPYEGMFDVVPRLVSLFEGRVWLISKAHSAMQAKTRLWLAHHRFFERTGIPPEHLRFCLERQEKAQHCREVGITHFVDDRIDVLTHLRGVVQHRYLFGPQKAGVVAPRDMTAVVTWAAMATLLLDAPKP